MRPTGEEPPKALGAAVGRVWRAGPDGAHGEPGLRLSWAAVRSWDSILREMGGDLRF